MPQIFLNLAPPLLIEYAASTLGIALAVVFFLVFCGAAIFAYKMMKRTVKIALRIMIVAAILLIAVVGSLAFYFGIQTPQKPAPSARPPQRPAR